MKKEALKVRADNKLVCTMPYEEEEDRVCEAKSLRAEEQNVSTKHKKRGPSKS